MLRRIILPWNPRLRRDIELRNPWRAAFLSLIPCAGQIYNRQPRKALLFGFAWTVLLVAAVATFFAPFSNIVILALVLWAIYAFHDGYKTARRLNGDPWHLRLSLAYYIAWIFQLCILLLFVQYLLSFTVLKFRHMSEPALKPFIEQGDRFAIDVMTYRFREPRVGEVVYYRPRQITLDNGKHMYIEAPLNGIERIVAGPGETFSSVGGAYYRNGAPIAAEEGPINRWEVKWDYQLETPPETYIVIRSYTSVDMLGAAAPKMYEVLDVMGWEEACLVDREDIVGRAILVYNPPEHRKFL